MSTARPYDEFLGQSDPFGGTQASVWDAGSRNPAGPFGGSYSAKGLTGSPKGLAAFAGAAGSPTPTPNSGQGYATQQKFAQDAWLYGNGGRGPLMSGNRSTANGSRVPGDAVTQMNVGGRTTYVNREDLDGQGGIKPEAFQKYGMTAGQGGGGDPFGGGGDPFSTQNLLGVGMGDAQATQKKADSQWARRDKLNKEYAQQSQSNRNAMGASLKDTQATLKDAEDRYLKTIGDYEDRTAQDMSAVAAGIRKNARTALQEAGQYTRADGTMKTPQEIEADSTMIRDQVESNVQQQLTPMASAFNNAVTQMGQNFSQFAVANAQVRAAQQFQSIQYDLQQRGYLSEMVAANPETHVNLLDTLLAIGNVNAARQPLGGGGTGGQMGGGETNGVGNYTQGPIGLKPADNGTPGPFEGVSKKRTPNKQGSELLKSGLATRMRTF